MQTTSYVRGSPPPSGIGEVLKITHPGGSHIDYTYYDHGHYVHTVSNERQKVTTYTRGPTTPPTVHLVIRIDYPSDANTPRFIRGVHLQQFRPGTYASSEEPRVREFCLRRSWLTYRQVQS